MIPNAKKRMENPKTITPTIVPKPAKGTPKKSHNKENAIVTRKLSKLDNNPTVAISNNGIEECENMALRANHMAFHLGN